MLGSRKLLIFAIVSAVLLSLFVVCTSAEEVVREDPLMIPQEGVVLRSASAPEYALNSNGIIGFSAWLQEEGYTSSSNVFNFADTVYFSKPAINSGVEATDFYSPSANTVHCSTLWGDGSLAFANYTLGFDSPAVYEFLTSEVGLGEADFVYKDAPATIFALALGCLTSILGVGSQLVAFVIARPIVLIPIVAVVFVLGYGVIRRLVKGV